MKPFVAALLLLAPLSALADKAPTDKKKDRSHRMQAGIGVTAGSGYRIQFKYGDAGTCGRKGDDGKPANVCYDRLPTWLDVRLQFGVSHNIPHPRVVTDHRSCGGQVVLALQELVVRHFVAR